MIAAAFLLSFSLVAQADAGQRQRYAWSGEVRRTDGAVVRSARFGEGDDVRTAPKLIAELAEIELALQIERDFDGARRELEGLQARAAWVEEYVGQDDVLVRVALARSSLLRAQGDVDAAQRVLAELLPRSATVQVQADRLVCVPAPERLLALEQRSLADPRLVEARATLLARAANASAPSQEPPDLEAILRAAIDDGDRSVAVEIGQRAAPVLERILTADMNGFPEDAWHDALTSLMAVSSARAIDFIERNLAYDGFFWKKRVLRSMRYAEVLQDIRAWLIVVEIDDGSTEPYRFLEGGWCDILAHYALDADVAAEALGLVGFLAQRDALTPALQQALIAGWQSSLREVSEQVRRIAADSSGQQSLVPVLEAGLDHPRPEVSMVCAERLTRYVRSDGLRRAVGHPEAVVRAALAHSLGYRTVKEPYYIWTGAKITVDSSDSEVDPTINGQDADLFDRLLVDPSEVVRLAAVEALSGRNDVRPALETMLELTSDPSLSVRRLAVRVVNRADEHAPQLLARFAQDTDASVLDAVDLYLHALTQASSDDLWVEASIAPYSEAILLRLANRAIPLGRSIISPGKVFKVLGASITGPARLLGPALELALDGGDDRLLTRVLGMAPSLDPKLAGESFEGLAPELMARVFARAYALPGPQTFEALRKNLAGDPVAIAPAMLLVVRDEGLARELRAAAASLVAPSARPGDREALFAFLRSPVWRQSAPSASEEAYLRGLGYRLGSERRLADFLADETVGREVRGSIAQSLPEQVLDDRDVALAVVRHIDPSVRSMETLPAALQRLGGALEDGDAQRVRALALARQDDVSEAAIGYFGRAREARYFPWLVELLNVEGLGAEQTQLVRRAAAYAIASYLNDEAAEVLLAAAGRLADEDGLHEDLFFCLEKIRKYQDQVARWRTRQAGSAAREGAIVELLPLLEDAEPEVRAQAALGLATLGAVEQLPRIVHLLKDSKVEVRAAAKQALESLHRQEEARRQAGPAVEVKQD